MSRYIFELDKVESIRADLEEMAVEGWDRVDGKVDWDAFLVRVERRLDIDLPGDMLHPAIRKIQRIVRRAYVEASR